MLDGLPWWAIAGAARQPEIPPRYAGIVDPPADADAFGSQPWNRGVNSKACAPTRGADGNISNAGRLG